MTLKELATYDGRDGRPAYVAVSGTIYDVSGSPRWADGNHEGAHQAGQELTEALKTAPHVRSLIERFPVVGQLHDEPQAASPGRKAPWPLIIATLAVLALAAYMLL